MLHYPILDRCQGMGKPEPARLIERRERLGLSQSELARRVGVGQSSINRLEAGETRNPRHLREIARALDTSLEYLLNETDDPDPHEGSSVQILPKVSADALHIPMIDLAYGMGGTYLDGDDPEIRTEPFPLAFIRRYTKAKADELVFAEGLGDSMSPTIGTNDLLLIDRSENTLRIADQIWAFSFGGVGMIKRLRPRPDGSIAILSDNPNVPEDRAVDDELFLIGRVVAKVSKL